MSDGLLQMHVWPVYIGAALEGDLPPHSVNEPHNGGYQRGTISWEPDPVHQLVGRATILCPPGTYTHLVFFKHPSKPEAVGATKMPHPVTFTEPLNSLEVYPIVNQDLALSQMTNIHP